LKSSPNLRHRQALRVCNTKTSLLPLRSATNVTKLPPITFTHTADPSALRHLLLCSGSHSSTSSDSEQRIQTALQNCISCIAAYVPSKYIPLHLTPDILIANNIIVDGSNIKNNKTNDNSSSSIFLQHQFTGWIKEALVEPINYKNKNDNRVLIGFGRAIGDRSLVATIHDIHVLPEFRGRGLGRQIVKRLIQDLGRDGIVDIGAIVGRGSDGERFLERCQFGDDSEASTPMMLMSSSRFRLEG